ncbi:hypothetical protein CBM2589_A90919 [Cupriavidus taiwanensis]|uniref:Uncharacterized protein n=1 Tax=Cupriavidus taiwanensis TaxID=164546 RepID=A0A975XGX9_9BURK|nr:hypothetical protein CBM2589_A90919 [Cupriavidus taiwanensis]
MCAAQRKNPATAGFFVFWRGIAAPRKFPPPFLLPAPFFVSSRAWPDPKPLVAADTRFAETGTQGCAAGRPTLGQRSQNRVRIIPLGLLRLDK